MRVVFLCLLLLAVGLGTVMRLVPDRPEIWHADPLAAADPGAAGVRLVPPGAETFGVAPARLLGVFDAVIRDEPRSRAIAGSVAGGRISYVIRSRVFGFPDYVTVTTMPAGSTGSTFGILARSRFGGSDWGVNRDRLERWLPLVRDRLVQ